MTSPPGPAVALVLVYEPDPFAPLGFRGVVDDEHRQDRPDRRGEQPEDRVRGDNRRDRGEKGDRGKRNRDAEQGREHQQSAVGDPVREAAERDRPGAATPAAVAASTPNWTGDAPSSTM